MARLLTRLLRSSTATRPLLYTTPQRTLYKFQDEEFNLEYLEGDRTGIAVCTMTRPKAKNSIGKNMKTQFLKAMEILKFEQNIRVVILRSGASGIFCAGADLKERLKMPASEVGPFVSSLRQLSTDLAELPTPTIAALDGAAVGGGLELSLCCDMRVAASTAKLGIVETRLAVMPGGASSTKMGLVETRLAIMPGAGGTQRLARVVGPAVAKELIFTARVVDGVQAHRLGLVNEAVEQNDGGDAAYKRALEIADEIVPNGPVALKMCKQAINRGIEVDLNSGLAFEQACYAQVIPTKDRMEGLRAFNEKRPPKYIGE